MNRKAVLLLLASWLLATALPAQDTNEFQRIAKRIMDAYDVGDELQHAPDSASLYGGAYLGASSNGRQTASDILTKYEKLDFSTRLDFAPTSGHIFTIGFLQSLNHRRVDENTIFYLCTHETRVVRK